MRKRPKQKRRATLGNVSFLAGRRSAQWLARRGGPKANSVRPLTTGRALTRVIPQNSDRGSKRMPAHKRGAQPGNRNAWKDGRYSRARREQRQIEAEARRAREREWAATMPVTNYDAIAAALQRLKERTSH